MKELKRKNNSIGKKIVVMLVAFTMLFSVATFAGCTNDNSELLNELAQLRELLEEKSVLSQQLQELTELVNGMKEDNAGLAGKIEALQGGIDALTKRLGGLEASNGYLLGMIEDLQEQVEKLEKLMNNLFLRSITADDFCLTISVSSSTIQLGQNIEIETTFKNNSRKRLQIVHMRPLILAFIIDCSHYQNIRLSVADLSFLEVDEVLVNTRELGSNLARGQHELIATAHFGIVETISELGAVVRPSMLIRSNIITLTVK